MKDKDAQDYIPDWNRKSFISYIDDEIKLSRKQLQDFYDEGEAIQVEIDRLKKNYDQIQPGIEYLKQRRDFFLILRPKSTEQIREQFPGRCPKIDEFMNKAIKKQKEKK